MQQVVLDYHRRCIRSWNFKLYTERPLNEPPQLGLHQKWFTLQALHIAAILCRDIFIPTLSCW